jgi:hypothetical protein
LGAIDAAHIDHPISSISQFCCDLGELLQHGLLAPRRFPLRSRCDCSVTGLASRGPTANRPTFVNETEMVMVDWLSRPASISGSKRAIRCCSSSLCCCTCTCNDSIYCSWEASGILRPPAALLFCD